ncbi:hypothetical protein FRB93_012562 [Tulasnella sp. JGI-2019a]|nr:hypothetical protein FRB93_012562 [Tulasnella sp. JGI-2019a]
MIGPVYDILYSIFLSLDEFKGTLRSTGLVCRAWYEPAMDVLWAKNISLHNLLAVLSPLEMGENCMRDEICFSQPLTPQSWSRFHSLSRRVRHAIQPDPPFDPTLVSELSSSNPNPNSPLLPSVQRLVLRAENKHNALMWLNSTVNSLDFLLVSGSKSDINRGVEMSGFGADMARLCPNLTDLRLAGRRIAIGTLPIGGLGFLHTVTLDISDVTAILLELAKLPAVKTLILHRVPKFPSQWPQLTIIPFPKLETLHIRQPSHPGTTTFLRNLVKGGSRLRELKLGCPYGDPEITPRAAGEHRYLEHLEFWGNQISLSTFVHIFPCGSLTDLRIYGSDLAMVDEDLAVLGRNLPKINHFHLGNEMGRTWFTFRALSIAVMSWPSLENLTLNIDVTGALPPEDHTPHRRLHTLCLIYPFALTKPMEVASFIAGLSDANEFQLQCRCLDGWGGWGEVKASLSELRKERLRAKIKGAAQGFTMAP